MSSRHPGLRVPGPGCPSSAVGPWAKLGPTGVGEESLAPSRAVRAGQSWPCPGLTAEASGRLGTPTHSPSPPHTQPFSEPAKCVGGWARSRLGNADVMMVLQTCFGGRKVRSWGTVVITNSGDREHCRRKGRTVGKTREPRGQGLLDTPVERLPSALELPAYERNRTTVANV